MNTLIDKILQEGILLEDKVVNFQNANFGNFVVMMGSPGSGKTHVAKNLLLLKNFKHLTVDNWLEIIGKQQGLDLKNPDVTAALNNKYEDKFKTFRKNFIKQQLSAKEPVNIVVDVTGKSIPSVRKVLDVIENSNYITTLVYVITSKEECLKRNLKRARTVPEDFLIAIYDDIEVTYHNVFSMFDNVYEVINEDLWQTFTGNEEYMEVNGVKYLKARTGTY